MAHDVDISVGADTSAAGAGLAALRNQASAATHHIQEEFRSLTSVSSLLGAAIGGGLVEAFKEAIEKAHEIHHESERFGIDAQQLQLIANAAKEDGVGLEQVARALNKVGLAGDSAAPQIEALGLNTAEFLKLSPSERFLAIADALHKAGNNTETYAAVAKLLGTRFGTELIPILEKGREEILRSGASMTTMSDETVTSLDRVHRAWEITKTFLVNFFGGTLAIAVNGIQSAWAGLENASAILRDGIVMDWKIIGRAMHFDWDGVREEFHKGAEQLAKDNEELKERIKEIWHPEEEHRTPHPTGEGSSAGGGGDEAGGAGGGGSRGRTNLAQKEHEAYLALLDDQEKLKALQQDRDDLQEKLNQGMAEGTLSSEEEEQLRGDILDKEKEITGQQDQINQAQEKHNRALADAKERIDELKAPSEAVAEQMRIQYEYQQKIDAALKEGHQDVADMLATERDLTLEKQKQADAEEAARKKREFDKKDNAARLVGKMLDKDGNEIGGTGIDNTNPNYVDYDVIRATRRDGSVDQAMLNRLRTENRQRELQFALTGRSGNAAGDVMHNPFYINPTEQIGLNNKAIQIDAAQRAKEQADQQAAMLAELKRINQKLTPQPGGY